MSSAEDLSNPSTTEPVAVYTDGACSGNPGPGGWAWATRDGRQGSGGEDLTTNQRMELQAVLEALGAIEGPVVVHSDSTYVVNCFNDRWYEGWLARGWKTSQRKPVANRDLWEPLIERYLERSAEIDFRWVKGHSGDEMNDLVDALAVAEAQERRADAVPEVGGSGGSGAGVETAATGPVPPWPVDRAVAVTGRGEADDDLLAALAEAIDRFDPTTDVLISGLRRGPELVGAERAVRGSVPVGVVLPFADPAHRWPSRDRRRFDLILDRAEWVVTLEADPAKPGAAIEARDRWIERAVVGAIVVDDPALATRLDQAGLSTIPVQVD